MEYVGINQGEHAIKDERLFINEHITIHWNKFRKHLNAFLQAKGIQEDKLLGPFFLNNSDRASKAGFAGKILLYLWDDVLRHGKRGYLFKADSLSFMHDAIDNTYILGDLFDVLFIETFIVDPQTVL